VGRDLHMGGLNYAGSDYTRQVNMQVAKRNQKIYHMQDRIRKSRTFGENLKKQRTNRAKLQIKARANTGKNCKHYTSDKSDNQPRAHHRVLLLLLLEISINYN